jgi:hypothetical protein
MWKKYFPLKNISMPDFLFAQIFSAINQFEEIFHNIEIKILRPYRSQPLTQKSPVSRKLPTGGRNFEDQKLASHEHHQN